MLGYLVPTAHTVSGPSRVAPAAPRLVAENVFTADGSAAATVSGLDVLESTQSDTTGLSVRTAGGYVQRRVLSTDLVDALTEIGLAPGDEDLLAVGASGQPMSRVPVARGVSVVEGMLVSLVRITHQQEATTVPVPFNTRSEPDAETVQGTTTVVDPGAPGVRTIVADVTLADGVPGARRVLSDQVTTAPRDRVVKVGTRPVLPEDHRYGVTFVLHSKNVTSYCLTGTTFTGTQAGPGSIAVDPSVIKLGSHLYVEGYGFGWAVDTGGGIHGDAVDVWNTCDAAIQWGRRAVTVYVLDH